MGEARYLGPSEYEQAILDAGIREDCRFPYGSGGYDYFAAIEREGGFGACPNWKTTLHRDAFVKRFAWAIPGEGALAAIAAHAPILEVGAGSGYWAYELAKRGVDIVATDPEPGPTQPAPDADHGYVFEKAWHPVVRMDGLAALKAHPGRTLLLVWPCYSRPWSGEVLAAYGGDVVLFVGEAVGGCTGDEQFHALLGERFDEERDVPIPQWWGIHDRLFVYRRASNRRET